MNNSEALANAIDRFEAWYVGGALPLFAAAGVDPRGGFHESLGFDGAPVGGKRRVRVQCRQIHVFADAGRRGWLKDGEAIAERGFTRLLETACPKDGARGCVHALNDDGTVSDHLRDLYDQAFLLLACAARIEAKDDRAFALSERTLAFLDREFASPFGGYRENDRGGLPRRQNPYMHLFEALMALHAASGDDAYLARTRAIDALFHERFLDRGQGLLREFFNDEWSLVDRVSDRIEPGHMMEWVSLFGRFEALSSEDRSGTKTLLYRSAKAMSAPGDAPFLPNVVMLGHPLARSARRLWPQTEFLRAALTLARDGDQGAAADAQRLIAALFASYFSQPVEGLWQDEYDAAGLGLATAVPASILYHLHEAVSSAVDCRHRLAA